MICHLHVLLFIYPSALCCFFVISLLFLFTHKHTDTHTSQALQEAVSSRKAEVDQLQSLSQSLRPLITCAADQDWLGERVGAVRSGHSDLTDWCTRRAALLEQALANAQLFGEEEVEVLNWLEEVAQRLSQFSIQSYQPQLLNEQHKHSLVRLPERSDPSVELKKCDVDASHFLFFQPGFTLNTRSSLCQQQWTKSDWC